ncbi:hypothetical protein CLF_110096 [Clonorchis sinensis]|uniref:Integrase catalytic domain-containing protein n=1 Tax=Clonorchis sinensis TaxID=79923 RepID=G7YK93_CLOSI|nr:hypothetical protein CLF_110096 [Clonorchis sinensis]
MFIATGQFRRNACCAVDIKLSTVMERLRIRSITVHGYRCDTLTVLLTAVGLLNPVYYSETQGEFDELGISLYRDINLNPVAVNSSPVTVVKGARLGYAVPWQLDLEFSCFDAKHHSTIITDASPTGVGAIVEQCGRPVICISRRLSKAELFLTTSPSAEFTQQALRKVFSHEGVPTVLVTDNGTHFTAKFLEEWLKSLGCGRLFTAPRHPQSNGLAENFVRTLKSAIISFSPTTFVELDRGIDNFLIQYRNAVHSATGKSPAFLFKSRSLRTSLDCAQMANVTFVKGNDLRPATGIILSSSGKRMVTILDLDDLSSHRRH